MRRITFTGTPAKITRADRKLVGVSTKQYQRLKRLRNTNLGKLSMAAVVARVVDMGLKTIESEDPQ